MARRRRNRPTALETLSGALVSYFHNACINRRGPMRIQIALVSTLTTVALTGAQAQVAVAAPRSVLPSVMRLDSPRAAIGLTTMVSTGVRDTLGLLVSSVVRNSPAEKAGIEEGNRIAMINGVNLKLAAADIGDPDMERLMGRRLTRELDKVNPGDDVELRVYVSGQTKTMKVKTVTPSSLYETVRVSARRELDERPSLGVGLGSSGSKRDTLGVFVMSVDETGPAAKAGIEEGHRIAAINGVDLRVARDDAGDDMVSRTKMNRLERELAKVKAGDAVDLRVFANGQTRAVKVTTVAASTLRGRHSIEIYRGSTPTTIYTRPPHEDFDLHVDGELIGTTVRRAIERAQSVTGERLEDLGHFLDNLGRGLNHGGTIRWLQSDPTPLKQPLTVPPMPPAPVRRTYISM
jgi:predicted metalloprotease with PDZ domain